jgi:cold shock CspA family protein
MRHTPYLYGWFKLIKILNLKLYYPHEAKYKRPRVRYIRFLKQIRTPPSGEVINVKSTVTWYDIIEGCDSFQAESGEDVRFYRKVLTIGAFLNEGDFVEFDIEGSDKGPQVTNVKKL